MTDQPAELVPLEDIEIVMPVFTPDGDLIDPAYMERRIAEVQALEAAGELPTGEVVSKQWHCPLCPPEEQFATSDPAHELQHYAAHHNPTV